jgi:hypothetical protein
MRVGIRADRGKTAFSKRKPVPNINNKPGNFMNPKNAVQPRMNTDGHECRAVVKNGWFTRWVKEISARQSVFMCVHPWLTFPSADFNCGLSVASKP